MNRDALQVISIFNPDSPAARQAATEERAQALYERGRVAEQQGDIVRAGELYAQSGREFAKVGQPPLHQTPPTLAPVTVVGEAPGPNLGAVAAIAGIVGLALLLGGARRRY